MSPFFGAGVHRRSYASRPRDTNSAAAKESCGRRHDSLLNSQQNMPLELHAALKSLDEQFWVSGASLREITTGLTEALEKGLEGASAGVAVTPTWVFGLPTGQEIGSFLTLDVGEFHVTPGWVEVGGRLAEIKTNSTTYGIPADIQSGDPAAFWGFVADSAAAYIQVRGLRASRDDRLPLACAVSGPALEKYVTRPTIKDGTTGIDINSTSGRAALGSLQNALSARGLGVRLLLALIDYDTAALITSTYKDPHTVLSGTFGEGCSAAYIERCSSIPMIQSRPESMRPPPTARMIVTCDYGSFSGPSLPCNHYDELVDTNSATPGKHIFEKLSTGHYMGELFRLVVLDLFEKDIILQGHDSLPELKDPYSFDAPAFALVDTDESLGMADTRYDLEARFAITARPTDLPVLRHVARMISERSARLSACAAAAVCSKARIAGGSVAVGGSEPARSPEFQRRWSQAVGEIVDWPVGRGDGEGEPLRLALLSEGPDVGAAIVAAMTMDP